jgi:signal transduction histidine kinase
LQNLLPTLQKHTIRLNTIGLSGPALEALTGYLARLQERRATTPPLSTVALSDQEETIEAWLRAQGIENGWELAATFAATHVTLDELATLIAPVPAESVGDLLVWLCEALTAAGLLTEIGQGAQRISDLVGAIKSYTYMDQGVLQEVDIHRDLENTLLVLKHKLNHISVERTYDPTLPHLLARGAELNQVWTNLIDNAVDALATVANGTGKIQLITRCENNFIMVEVADNGPGIPDALVPRLFEPFFTTKEVGSGTGLGLDISYRIVQRHSGTITVDSVPGRTRFIVRLPLQQHEQPAG